MSFSDKMRESLGAEGARIGVAPPSESTPAGTAGQVSVSIVGGTQAARIESMLVRLVQATRHWVAADGTTIAEADAPPREQRKELTAAWDRTTLADFRVDVGHTVEPDETHVVEVEVSIPVDCASSSAACNHTVNVQADIKGQIDPTGNARITVS